MGWVGVVEEKEKSGVEGEQLVVITHKNVDIDALVSSYLLQYFYDVLKVTTDPASVWDAKVVIVDMPIDEELRELVAKNNLTVVAHYDHHYEGCPHSCTAEVIREAFKDRWEKWMNFFVDLARICDTAEIVKQPDPIKYFHISGLIAVLRKAKYSDDELIEKIFTIFDAYTLYFKKKVEAEEKLKDVPIHNVGKYTVAIVRDGGSEISSVLTERGVTLIIYESNNNLGIVRNANCEEPDLKQLKLVIEAKLREKGREDEVKEWFFHPKGFIVCRGSRKHPVKTPSALSAEDLLEALKIVFG